MKFQQLKWTGSSLNLYRLGAIVQRINLNKDLQQYCVLLSLLRFSSTSYTNYCCIQYCSSWPQLILLAGIKKTQLCTKGTLLKAALDISDRPCTCVVITIFYYNTSLHLCCNLLYFFLFSLMVLEAPQNFLFLLCREGWPRATEYVYMAEHIIWIPKRSTATSTQSW